MENLGCPNGYMSVTLKTAPSLAAAERAFLAVVCTKPEATVNFKPATSILCHLRIQGFDTTGPHGWHQDFFSTGAKGCLDQYVRVLRK